MVKRRKAKRPTKAKSKARKTKRAAPARKRRAVKAKRGAAGRSARKAKVQTKAAKPKARRTAKSKLPPRWASADAPRPMSPPGPAVTPIAPRPSPFPSSLPADGGPYGGRGQNND
jgi:hypothetical protein